MPCGAFEHSMIAQASGLSINGTAAALSDIIDFHKQLMDAQWRTGLACISYPVFFYRRRLQRYTSSRRLALQQTSCPRSQLIRAPARICVDKRYKILEHRKDSFHSGSILLSAALSVRLARLALHPRDRAQTEFQPVKLTRSVPIGLQSYYYSMLQSYSAGFFTALHSLHCTILLS